ncbi:hemagglutinin repeat-containing protein [Moraxella bovis]|uniref:two-partner secretion domain-containing protein n=1 Tax=Moraxella bovis TaxID=476 RepID=UPI0022261138|nr:hemagglutinin repeat-containing protein [Moraxella bovis]UZA23530.1 hemagglutinin repeat-containing protein [Moraxella bovis]
MTSQQDSFGYGLYGKFKLASMAVLLGLTFSVTSYANPNTATTIIADPSAPKNLQPTILPTASGIVSVNIATPNDKGLSNNHYSQFDVGSTGAVLNNNRKAVNTQIAGYVQANPFMAKGEASTILNQINSNNPSHLGGFIEVAGKRADVIIANPNGLVINGTGFINAGNVHLVAANGKFDQGQITGYQVNTGNIEVNGKLNLQNTDYAALIAKTAQINDEIYAGSVLDIVTGENTVTLQDGKFNQLSAAHKNDGASSTNQTGIALDVAALGGMYAGKIRLIGTDKGFGVNNQGMIAATGSGVQAGTGTLTLDHQGNLVNTGIASAKDKVTINTQSHHVHNAGTLLGEQSDIAIDTAKLTNTGTIASTQNTKITATNAIDNQGSMYGGVLQVSTDELTNTGKLVQTGTGKLTISTHTLTNTNKAAIGQSLYEKTQLKAPSVPSTDQSAGMVSHQPADNTTTNNSNNGANTPNPSTDTPSANGFISTTKSLNNTGDKALITATGDTHITANQTSNTNQASIDVQTLNTNTLANTDSKIALDNINWQLTSFDNSKGDIVARDKMVIASQSSIINTEGRLVADSVVLGAKSELDNGDGVVQSAGDVSVTASKVTNNQGIIHGAHALMINANGILTNNAGVISGAQDTTITAKTAIDNADGRIQSDGKLNINTQQLNSTGTIYAAQGTTITASHVNNEQTGLIASAKDVRIDTQSLTSAGTISAGMQSDGKLGNTPANISIQATEGIRSSGNNIATGTLTLNANTINLDDSKTQADHITLLAQDTISTRKTSTVASNSLAITAPNKLDNSEGILSANEVIVNTDVLENRQGAISQAGKTALSLAIKRSIDNTLGTISTNSDKLKIDTNQLINQQGAIHHAGVGELNIKSENLNNSQGELLSLGAQTLNIKAIDNSQGIISATGFTINADGLDNTAGLLQATDKEADNSLNIDSTLDNNKLAKQQGSIDVAGNLTLTAKALQNQGAITANNLKATVANVNNTGAIGARDNIQIASSQDIDNTGNISATGNIVLNANNTISHQGVMMAADSITATANRLNFNQSTSSADNISLSAQADIHHNQGTTVAKDKLSLKNTSTIYNQGGVLSANHASVNTKDLQNGGIIQADVLAIKQQADYKHTDNDKLLANNLQFSTDGKIINQSQLTAGQDLTLSANHIDNTQTGTIKSGNHTQITSQTSINNQGLINGETTVIKANDTINNQSGGRIYGTHLAIQADTLNNTPAKAEQSDGKYTTPVIAARERLDIGVKTLNNNPNPDRAGKFNENFDNQALITSLGSLHIGGSLDDNHYATGKADAVINQGATIESGGEMVVDTKTLLNGNADFKKHKVEVIEESVRKQTLYRAHEQASTIPAAQKSTDTADLDKKPMAGLFDCPPDSDCIINYDNNSVIWTHFGIEPPKEPIPDIKAKDLLDEPELPEGEDAQSCALAGADNQACTQYKEALAHYTKVMGPFNYTLGTALTPDQMANLTTDIVWLVKQSITYTTKDKDGNSITKIEDVLVPKLYLRSATTDTATLTKDGRLSTISGKNMDIRLTGNLDNNGNFIAKDTMSITADNATNKGVIKGNYVAIETKNNIVNHNQIHADSAARLIAGNDIINESLTTTKQSVVGRSRAKNTAITQIATISVGKGLQGATDENGKPLTTLSLRGNHVLFKAGASHNAGDGTTQITATNGIKLDTVTQTNQLHAVADDNNYFNYDSSKQSGSSVTGVGNVVLAATGENADIDITASQVGSQAGTVALLAQGEGGSVNVEEGRATSQLDSAWLTKTSRAFGSKTEQSRYKQTQDNVVGSQIDGNNILMIADKDITITASQVVGEKQTKLQAGNDITIGSSLNHAVSETSQYRSKSGLMSAGNMGVSIGKEKSAQNTTQTSTTQVGSMVGSLNGDTTIIAKENYTQNVSTVSSPVGDVNIVAGQVTISSKDNTYQSINNSEYEKKGITVSANIPIVNSVQTALNTTKTIGQSSNDRINAMASANAAWQAKKTAEDVGKLVQDASLNTLNPSISISYGQQKSTSQSHTQSTTAQGSQVNAGGQVNIIATGGQDSSIVIAGSDVAGRGGTHLSADHDITITAAKQTQTEDSTNASRGFSVGANISAVGGHSATIGANRGKGNSNSQTTTHIHSHIGDEQSQTTLKAGNQLTLKGAGIKGEEVIVTADKLTMSSLQDTATYHSNQQNVSASATFGTGASVGGDYGKSNIDANYTSVTEQTGIFAGDKGAKVTITGHTDITGAIITSTAKAEQTGKNQFATGTLTISHLDNESYHKGDSLGIGATASISANTLGQTPSPDSKLKATSKANGVSTNGIGYGQDSDHQTSTTQGGIYTQNITITDEAKQADIAKAQGKSVQDIITNAHISTTTTEYQNNGYQATTALTNGFDKDEVQRELDVQVAVTKDFGQNAPKAVADFSEGQRDKYLEQLNNPSLTHEEAKAILDEAQKWEEGGVYRIALHTATGLLATGGVEGALTTGGVATIAPKLDEWQDKITTKLIEQGFEKETAESVSKFTLNLAIATAGTTAGLDTSSTAYALNADMNNRQLHPPEKELAKSLFEKAKREGLKTADGNEYTLEQFEDALRLANHSGYNETYLSNIQESYEQSGRVLLKVHQPATNGDILQDFDLENPYQKWSLLNQSTEDGVTTFNLIQNLGVLHKPDENLVRFIKANDKQDNYSWADGWIQPYRPSIVESHSPNNTPKSTYPDWAIKSRNEFIANNHIDLSSSSQAKSDKLMNERVMPVVETTVAIGGATAITAGCVATGGTLCAVVAGGSIVMAGDTAITQADNFGKPVSQHDTSKLLQGAGLSKDEAQIAKLATEAAMGVGAIKGIVNAKNAKQVAQAQKQIDMARVENNVGRDEDVFYKPIKITGEPKDLKEYNDASKFTYLNDGGEFKFSETKNQQGIEGYFVNQLGDKIPISLKNLETSSPRKVMTVINKNAKSILEAEALPSNNPHKLPIGTLNDTVLHIQTPNISKQQLVDELTNYPFQGNGGKYKIIIFETKDGGFTLQNGKIESYPK